MDAPILGEFQPLPSAAEASKHAEAAEQRLSDATRRADAAEKQAAELRSHAAELQQQLAARPQKEARRGAVEWLRGSGLGAVGFLLVLVVAGAGWSASFIGLHDFAMTHMGLNQRAAWLVPVTFDGAPLGLTLVVYRASLSGRGAVIWRTLIFVFTGLSSWINWQHIDDPTGRWIASFMPPAAVILFEGLMSEARAGASDRPRLHPLRWIIDRSGTWAMYRAYVMGIDLPEHLKKAQEPTAVAPSQSAQNPASKATSGGAPKAPQRQPSGAPRKPPAGRHKNVDRGVAKAAVEALYEKHGRRPQEGEMTAELQRIGSPYTSRQFAQKLRAELEEEQPKLAELGTDNVRALSG